MFRIESTPVDNPKAAPSGLNIGHAGAMDTYVTIARLRRLIDHWHLESLRLANLGVEEGTTPASRVLSGRSLGLEAAAAELDDLLRDLIRVETRRR